MADQRTYELASAISTYDGDVYLVVDKLGFARSKQYKMSVLKGHLKVGDQQYTEQNYVTNDETLTKSVDDLDMALKNLSDTVDDFTGVLSQRVSLSTTQVAALGTAFTLLSTPASANTAYQLIDIKWAMNPTTQLDVGSQDLKIYFEDVTNYLGFVRNVNIESSVRTVNSVQVQPEHEIGVEKKLFCRLSDEENPVSGVATMDFYIIYKIITIPEVIS